MRRYPPGRPASVRQEMAIRQTALCHNYNETVTNNRCLTRGEGGGITQRKMEQEELLRSRLTCHTHSSLSLARVLCFFGCCSVHPLTRVRKALAHLYHCGLSTRITSVVSWPSRLSERRREQPDCQSLIVSDASLTYFVSFGSRSGPPHVRA